MRIETEIDNARRMARINLAGWPLLQIVQAFDGQWRPGNDPRCTVDEAEAIADAILVLVAHVRRMYSREDTQREVERRREQAAWLRLAVGAIADIHGQILATLQRPSWTDRTWQAIRGKFSRK